MGLNNKDSERAADMVLYSEFDSPEVSAVYSRHSAHMEVVTFVREIASETRVVDYEVQAFGLGAKQGVSDEISKRTTLPI